MVRTEKELLIATKSYASENRFQSWRSLFLTLALYFATLGICFADLPLGLQIIASIFSGLLIVRMFIFYHDYQHQAILSHSFVARIILDAYGLLVLSPPSVWNRSHDHHHKHNSKDLLSSMGSFPTMTCEQYAATSFSKKVRYYFARHPLTIALGYITIFMCGMCIRAVWINPRLHKDAAFAIVIHAVIVYSLILCGWDKLVLCLMVPLTIACALGSYLFYAQHNFPGCRLHSREDWSHTSAALKSSSYLKMNPVMNWFTGNIGYHHIHHLNAKIPFYRLPEVMRDLPELQKPASTTLRPLDVLACFRSNLWDTDSQQLVSFRDARLARLASKSAVSSQGSSLNERQSESYTSLPDA
ncbi:MAG: fatty acid desaturase [Pirellula sp.]